MTALHAHASRELGEVFDDFAADDDAWVAVLTGEGDRAFSAGNDLKYTAEMSRLTREQRPDLSMPAGGFGGITNRFDLFKPVIARVNGFALGGGLEMALACDIIVAADHAEVGLPEPRRGLIAGALGVHRLPRHLPLKQAMGYLLTGRHIRSAAYEIGLVNEVVPLAQLDDAVAAGSRISSASRRFRWRDEGGACVGLCRCRSRDRPLRMGDAPPHRRRFGEGPRASPRTRPELDWPLAANNYFEPGRRA